MADEEEVGVAVEGRLLENDASDEKPDAEDDGSSDDVAVMARRREMLNIMLLLLMLLLRRLLLLHGDISYEFGAADGSCGCEVAALGVLPLSL